MFSLKAKLIYNKKIKGNYFRCLIDAPLIAKKANPGQFVNIKVSDTITPLLRRPFSIHRVKGEKIEILYEALGEGTKILSQRKPGEYLEVIGPLGSGFDYSSQLTAHSSQVLVAGGMGVAPLIFLAEKITAHSSQLTDYRLFVVIGAKTKSQILCEKEFRDLGCEVKIATDDGSKGFRGRVTDLLKNILLTTYNLQLTTIYACGPRPMLKEIAVISQQYNIPAQVSLEEHMACGFGACLGCVVNTEQGFKRVCKEGPVFNSDEIRWE